MNKKSLLAFSLILCTAVFLPAKEKISDNIDLSARFYMNTDNFMAPIDFLDLGVELEGRFDAGSDWEFNLELDASYDEVETEEIWVRYEQGRGRWQLGMFENEILLEDQFSSKAVPFRMDALIRRYMDSSGWYTKRALGLKAYRHYKEKSPPYSGFAHLFFNPSGREVQANAGLFYPYRGEESWLGVTAAYYPYWVHNGWVGQQSTYAQDNNYLFQAVIADLSAADKVIYKADMTVGSNLIDPVGIIHFPGEGEASWFAGSDIMVGLPLEGEDFIWTPGINTSFLIYDLNTPESWGLALKTGQLLAWDDTFFLHLEGGTHFLTNYDSDGGDSFLQTSMEIIWGVSFQIRL